jgi:hypothetical protein
LNGSRSSIYIYCPKLTSGLHFQVIHSQSFENSILHIYNLLLVVGQSTVSVSWVGSSSVSGSVGDSGVGWVGSVTTRVDVLGRADSDDSSQKKESELQFFKISKLVSDF